MGRVLSKLIGSRAVAVAIAAGFALALPCVASATLIESWENTLDGWAAPPSYNVNGFSSAFSTTTGVTDGSYSLALVGTTSGPNYGQMLYGPSTMALTSLLSNASAIDLDVYAPAASFGYYLQVQIGINNSSAGIGFDALTSYVGVNIGGETTLSAPISPALDALLAASPNPTAIFVQVGGGYSAGNETAYFDNLRSVDVPEPATLSILGAGLGLLGLRRSRRV
jgi:hypothetical protein